ncbi:hypothetical protein J8273_0395 [Carpediemonas membranifera]|uniref:Uncharacterized protein n=1 Tax=Carpediemonas membranifera TaxID=201153 RepID=A0A8J6AZH1_9EUKA|nr:hypothetical protein J8273_0395 [Carpediemonas membranifera]|eukprot:KAG9395175.1 hypothetical protein J8273_0395 [Carpediemonas membranifera]
MIHNAINFISGASAAGTIELTVAKASQYSKLPTKDRKIATMLDLYRRSMRTMPINMIGGGSFFTAWEMGHPALGVVTGMNSFLADLIVGGFSNVVSSTLVRPVGVLVTSGPKALRKAPATSIYAGFFDQLKWSVPASGVNQASFACSMKTLYGLGLAQGGGYLPSMACSGLISATVTHATVGTARQFAQYVAHTRAVKVPGDAVKLWELWRQWLCDADERAEWVSDWKREAATVATGGFTYGLVRSSLRGALGMRR